MIVDLHTHSTFSDGQYTPAQLVGMAKDAGVQVLALTDHDTFRGAEEAYRAGAGLGVQVLRGIELSAREYRNLHILGYQFSPDSPALTALCEKVGAAVAERKYRLVRFLQGKGLDICLEEVEAMAGGGAVRRPHFARVLVEKGYVQTMEEAFQRYLDTDEYKKIEPWKATARECIETLKAAGGWVSFAHPYQVGLEDGLLEGLVKELKGYGLDAIECFYPRYTPAMQALYLSLAKKYGLHATGGSDFHGEKVKPDITLAQWDMDIGWLL